MKKATPKRQSAALQLRIPRALLDHLNEVAQANGRSLNSEISMRLAETLGGLFTGPSNATYERRAK